MNITAINPGDNYGMLTALREGVKRGSRLMWCVPVPYTIPVPDDRLKADLIAEYDSCVKEHKKLLLKHSLVARKNPAQARALLARIITERDWIDDLRTAITNEYPDVKFV